MADDEEPVQAEGHGDDEAVQASGGDVHQAIASQAIERAGAGRPLDQGVRNRLEPAFGADLSHVRVHDGPEDREAAEGINARAFAHGSDIWLGPGESQSDVRLMAHEVTHLFQQGGAIQTGADQGSVQRSARGGEAPLLATGLVQRENAGRDEGRDDQGGGGQGGGAQTGGGQAGGGQAGMPAMTESTGVLDEANKEITFSQIEVPAFKVAEHRSSIYKRPLVRSREYTEESRKNTRQRDVWRRDLGKETKTIETALQSMYEKEYGAVAPGEPYVFKAPSKLGKNRPMYYLGELPAIAKALTLPQWDEAGEPHSFDVDHVLELQLANWPKDKEWPNSIANMELLDSSVNRSSGSVIKTKIEEKIASFIRATNGHFGTDSAQIKKKYDLKFKQAVGGNFGKQPGPNDFWTTEEIQDGDHLVAVSPANLVDVGGNGKVRIFPSEAGSGLGKQFALRNVEGQEAAPANRSERDWLSPFVIKRKKFVTEGDGAPSQSTLGAFWVNVKENDSKWQTFPEDKEIPIHRWQGARYLGYIDKQAVRPLEELAGEAAKPDSRRFV